MYAAAPQLRQCAGSVTLSPLVNPVTGPAVLPVYLAGGHPVPLNAPGTMPGTNHQHLQHTAQHSTAQHSTAQHSTAQHSTQDLPQHSTQQPSCKLPLQSITLRPQVLLNHPSKNCTSPPPSHPHTHLFALQPFAPVLPAWQQLLLLLLAAACLGG